MSSNITIPFAYPHIEHDELKAVQTVLKSRWLTTGTEALEFEKEFVSFLQVKKLQALAVQSCTAGLHLAYNALNTNNTHTVITSPLTFFSTVSPAIHCGAKIEFIDTAPNSLYPNASSLEKLIVHTNKTNQILTLVPLAGYHPYYNELFELASQQKIKTIEDAAHAFPAQVSYNNSKTPYGTIADIGVYSFYANKTITTGEGGMVVSKNPELIKKISLLRNHGIDRNTWDRFSDKPEKFSYDISVPGYKYNLPDILATLGRIQLKKATIMQEKRFKIAQYYTNMLPQRSYLKIPEVHKDSTLHSWHLFIIQITHPNLSRNDFMEKLAQKGIGTSVHYTPLHLMSYFKNISHYKPEDFPNALNMFYKILSLPIYPDLTHSQIEYICNAIIEIGDNH